MSAAPAEVKLPETDDEQAADRPWIVIVWNDPINLMSYVVLVFQKLFGYNREKATELMLDVHHKGRAVVSSRDAREGRAGRLPPARARPLGHDEAGLMFGRNRPKPRVAPVGDSYELRLDERERALIRQILGDMRALLMLDADDPRVRRLYPSAYADDAGERGRVPAAHA